MEALRVTSLLAAVAGPSGQDTCSEAIMGCAVGGGVGGVCVR